MAWETSSPSRTLIYINGTTTEVDQTEPFKSTVRSLAIGKGFSRFKVFADGEQIKPENAPETFVGIGEVRIEKYDESA